MLHLVLTLILSLSVLSDAFSQKMAFSHLSVSDGLSPAAVNSICQDKDGNMWFATEYGLNRYDGDIILTYLRREHVRKLHLDPSGVLFAASEHDLFRYDSSTDVFSSFPVPKKCGDIYDFTFVGDSLVLVACRWELTSVDLRRNSSADEGFVPEDMKSLRVSSFEYYRGDVLMGCRGPEFKLVRWTPGTRQAEMIDTHDASYPLQSLLARGDTLWVGTNGGGIYRFNLENGEWRRFTRKDGLLSDLVRAVSDGPDGNVWAATFMGVNVIDSDRITKSICHSGSDVSSISHNSVRALCLDSQGGMWLGNYYHGIDYHHPLRPVFLKASDFLEDERVDDEIISGFLVLDDGSMWISAANYGILRYSSDGKFRSLYHLPESRKGKVISNDFKAMLPDYDRHSVWVAAYAGNLSAIDMNTGAIRTGLVDRYLDTYSLIPIDRSRLFVGTLSGLFIYDRHSGEYEKVDLDFRIKTMGVDDNRNLWLGGDTGIQILDYNLEPLNFPQMDSVRFVRSILKGADGKMWVSTDSGLVCFDPHSGSSILYSSEDGLTSDLVASAEEDLSGTIWVATSCGLNRLDPETGAIMSYFEDDGLPCHRFTPNAHYRLQDGSIVFGTLKGLVCFKPEEVRDNPFSPSPVINISYSDGRAFMPEDGRVSLKADENTFSLRFSVPNYLSGRRTVLRYMTDLTDSRWHVVKSGEVLHFSNVRHGNYKISLKSYSDSGASPETTVMLCVRPRWYQTLAFAISAILLFAILIFFIIRILHDRALFAQLLEKERNSRIGEGGEYLEAMDSDFIEKAMEIVKRNLSNPDFSTVDFASELCMSKSALYVKLKTVCGESALDFIRKVRFNEACRLLKEGRLQITEISEMTGFSSLSYFSTAFKKYVGCLPSEYGNK